MDSRGAENCQFLQAKNMQFAGCGEQFQLNLPFMSRSRINW